MNRRRSEAVVTEWPSEARTREEDDMLSEPIPSAAPPEVLERLRSMCVDRGLGALADRLDDLMEVAGSDLASIESSLGGVVGDERLAERAAGYLVGLGGKRLRPLCVALASRVGTGFSPAALELAVAVELVHNATLLHDDVIDLADTRRGRSTARAEFGNTASIFAGDWLLIEALQRVVRASVPGTLENLLETVAEMIRAESLQLENRARVELERRVYFEIAEGKSATLFKWAMGSGGRAGGLDEAVCSALEEYGLHLGVAFQVIDDLLDLTGGRGDTGKGLFVDLREGKMTYPVIVTLERDPALRPVLQEIMSVGPLESPPPLLLERVLASVRATSANEECRQLAAEKVRAAVDSLADVPRGAAVEALIAVAESTVYRQV